MIRIRKLNELFDSPVSYKVISKEMGLDTSTFITGFKVRGVEYEAVLTVYEGKMEIVFWIEDTYTNAYGISNTGNAVFVFSTIRQIVKDFDDMLQQYNTEMYDTGLTRKQFLVDTITFSAKEESRIKLYNTFAQKIIKEFPRFKTYRTYTDSDDNVHFEIY